MVIIGIDIGTTSAVVSYILPDGTLEFLEHSFGGRLMPSAVLFAENCRYFRGMAMKEMHTAPRNLIVSAKRLLGRRFDEDVVQKSLKLKRYPCDLEEDNGEAVICVT